MNVTQARSEKLLRACREENPTKQVATQAEAVLKLLAQVVQELPVESCLLTLNFVQVFQCCVLIAADK